MSRLGNRASAVVRTERAADLTLVIGDIQVGRASLLRQAAAVQVQRVMEWA